MMYRDWRKQQMRRPGFLVWWLWIAITNRWRNKKLLRMLAEWDAEPDVEFDASSIEPFALRPNHGVQPTAELAGRESIAAESEDVRQPAAADA
jgi:hypothetical protein